MTIYKYTLETTDAQVIMMPKASKILCVQTQHNTPCLWAYHDADNVKVPRQIAIFGTGHPMPFWESAGKYIGTYQLDGGQFVFHVFDQGEHYA